MKDFAQGRVRWRFGRVSGEGMWEPLDEAYADAKRLNQQYGPGTHWVETLGTDGRAIHNPKDVLSMCISSLSKTALVEIGTPEAVAELQRRGRGPDGTRFAWRKG
jgi:hypothetical protein